MKVLKMQLTPSRAALSSVFLVSSVLLSVSFVVASGREYATNF